MATITFKDDATGKVAQMPVLEPTHGQAVVDIGKLAKEFGYFTYDPGFMSTASCQGAITYLDRQGAKRAERSGQDWSGSQFPAIRC